MTAFEAGDIVLVPFPFTDLETAKKRPALALAWVTSKTLPSLAIVAMVTSQIESETIVGDYLLKDWKGAGLFHPSKVRLAKVVSVEEKIVEKKLGTLVKKDAEGVKKELWKVLSSWIEEESVRNL